MADEEDGDLPLMNLEQLERRTFLDGTLVAAAYLDDVQELSDLAVFQSGKVATTSWMRDGGALGVTHINPSWQANTQPRGTWSTNGGQRILQNPEVDFYWVGSVDGIKYFGPTGALLGTFHGGQLSRTDGKTVRVLDMDNTSLGLVAVSGEVLDDDGQTVIWSGVEEYNPTGDLIWQKQRPAGRIVAVSDERTVITYGDGQIDRLLPGGELDPSFANGVRVYWRLYDKWLTPSSLAVDGIGRIYVAAPLVTDTASTWAVARLTPDGQVDTSYGRGGMVDTGLPVLPSDDGSTGDSKIAVAPNGTVYAAGVARTGGDDDFVVVRVLPGGTIDTTFGVNGHATYDMVGTNTGAETRDIAIMPDGDVVVAGMDGVNHPSSLTPQHRVVVVRLDANPTPAAVPVASLISGKLHIYGTPGDDRIVIRNLSASRFNVEANGVIYPFFTGWVHQFLINTGDGKDYVDGSAIFALTTGGGYGGVTINGDAGNDTLVGSSTPDRIIGGSGDDKIAGLGGNDSISGNAQKDRIDGGEGDDTLLGNGGRDFLIGSAGNDSLLGGDQPDVLTGGDGDDRMFGEGGHDRLDGGAGLDFMSGGGGNDTFIARDGATDTVVGGLAATDRALVDDEDELAGIEELLA